MLDREERVRQYYLKSALKQNMFSPTETDTSTAMSDMNPEGVDMTRKIKVIDRFGMILQIFAARAKSQIA
jgi:50S ribosomal subunit-associated GTPase HflX